MARRLLYLNGIAIINVILYHASAWGFIALFWWTDRYREVTVPNFDQMGSAAYYGLRLIEQYVIYGIPAFLLISGFFVAVATGRNRVTVGWDFIFARLKNLLIPYVLWSIILLGFDWVNGRSFSFGEILRILLTGQAADAFYFIPMLTQLYLLSPFFIPLIKKNSWLVLLLVGIFQLLIGLLRYTAILHTELPILSSIGFLNRSFLFTGNILWFIFGIVFGFHQQEIRQTFYRFRWLLLTGGVIFYLLGFFEWEYLLRVSGEPWLGPRETFVDLFYAACFLSLFIAMDHIKLPFQKAISQIGAHSYGIYLSHTLALIFVAKLTYHFAPQILSIQWLFQPLLWIVGLGGPLILMAIVDRSPLRRYYALIFG
jgi:peptidoglycan/LPS O-acetylase OafA/YrhL